MAEVYESHFLPQEETTPDELQHLIQRVFRSAQEWEQDHHDLRLFGDADIIVIADWPKRR